MSHRYFKSKDGAVMIEIETEPTNKVVRPATEADYETYPRVPEPKAPAHDDYRHDDHKGKK